MGKPVYIAPNDELYSKPFTAKIVQGNQGEDVKCIIIDPDTNQEVFTVGAELFYKLFSHVPIVAPEIKMTTYDLNKNVISSMDIPTEDDKVEWLEKCDKFFQQYSYSAFFCKEVSHYTIFNNLYDNHQNATEILLECIEGIGIIRGMDFITPAEDPDTIATVEIWLELDDEEIVVAYLFNYEQGVECY